MARKEKQCWEKFGWERGDQLVDQQGNQSHTFLARKKTDQAGKFDYILKKLKRQELMDRRAMFHVEASAMSALQHPGVLTVEETNSHRHQECGVELFLITKKAPGQDLKRLVANGLAFEDAVRITVGVLDILKHCHARLVIHRDIKPVHVISDDAKFNSPVLIDFGIAHAEEVQPSDAATPLDQKKGNRFAIGPEHLPGSSISNQSGVTDLMQCVGLLFYSLTGVEPGVLRDENDLKPHQRDDVRFDPDIPEWKLDSLKLIFDKAFNWHPDDRWGAAEPIAIRLRELLEESISPDERLALMTSKRIQESKIALRVKSIQAAQEMSKQLFDLVDQLLSTIQGQTSEYLKIDGEASGFFGSGTAFRDDGSAEKLIKFTLKHGQGASLEILVATSLSGSQLIVLIKPFTGASVIFPTDQPVEMGRCTIGDRESIPGLRKTLEENFLSAIEELLSRV